MQISVNGIRLNYQIDGPQGAPWIVMSNSLATNFSMWNVQVKFLSDRYRILRYDQRGHGGSELGGAKCNFDLLADDVVGLTSLLGINNFHFIGLSMGGMTGMGIVLRYPNLLNSLIICNSLAQTSRVFRDSFDERIAVAESLGLQSLVSGTMERWFTSDFRKTNKHIIYDISAMVLKTPVASYVACARAVQKVDYLKFLSSLRIPVLLISGSQDLATPPEGMRRIHSEIQHSKYVELSPAAHLSNIEKPVDFNKAVLDFLLD